MEPGKRVADGHFRGFRIVEGLKEPEVKLFPNDEFEILVPPNAKIYKRKEDGMIRYFIDRSTNISTDTYIYDLLVGDAEHPSVLKYRGYIPRFPVYIDP
jgi:hypothetical protein